MRRATINGLRHKCASFYFYPRSPCGERPVTRVARTPTTVISIHALLAESDDAEKVEKALHNAISIHALLAESDSTLQSLGLGFTTFLSTLSLRRATLRHNADCNCQNISIHALLAESDTWARGSRVTYVISIHALLAESDT